MFEFPLGITCCVAQDVARSFAVWQHKAANLQRWGTCEKKGGREGNNKHESQDAINTEREANNAANTPSTLEP